jgi:hypothetical protein
MSKQYNILWLDDQFETLQNIRRAAKSEGIILTPFTSFEEGFEHLKANINKYDGILLDALFYESKDQTVSSEDSKGLIKSIDKINELKYKKVFPFFVLSGQKSFTEQENEILEVRSIRCYVKAKRQDWLELFEDIKTQADKLDDLQLKHKYADCFATCTDEYAGVQLFDKLLNILRKVEQGDIDNNLFNPARKIIEGLFIALNRHKLLPDVFIEGGVKLNAASRFLSGREELGYRQESGTELPKDVCDEIYFVLRMTQAGSHFANLTNRMDKQQTPYIATATTNVMLDLLVWFKNHIDSNLAQANQIGLPSKPEAEWISGIVESCPAGLKFINSESHTEVLLQSNIVRKYNITDGDNIEIQKDHPKSTTITNVKKL